jgi:aquaporin Z
VPDKSTGGSSTDDTGERASELAPRRLLAELIGTFALTLVAAGAVVVATVTGGVPGFTAQVIAPGLLVTVMIYSIGEISGAHINPVVTLAFALRRDFPWRRVPGYWLAQLLGSVLAALLLAGLFGRHGSMGATLPHHGIVPSLVLETVLTFLLVTVILATAANAKVVGPNAALAVGATVALDGLFAGPISGASMNPARSFGPALLSGHMATFWIYVAGPLAGSLLAVIGARLLRGATNQAAEKTATGG